MSDLTSFITHNFVILVLHNNSLDLAVLTVVNLRLIEEDRQGIRRQNVDIVRIREAEEEIEIQRVIKVLEAVILEIEIRGVTIPIQVDPTLRIAQKEKPDRFLETNREVLPAVRNRINQNLMLKRIRL